MKIQRTEQTQGKSDMFNSIDHEIIESIHRLLKTESSNITETSSEKSHALDSNRGALIKELTARMNRPYESDLREFNLRQLFLWLRWQDLVVYQTDQWNELIDYISKSDLERRSYKEVIYSLRNLGSMSDLDIERQNMEQSREGQDREDNEQEHNLKVIDNNESENIDQVKRIEDLYKKPLDINKNIR